MKALLPKRLLLVFFNICLAVVFTSSLVFFVFHLIFLRQVVPGVYLEGVGNLSGLSEAAALKTIDERFSDYRNREIVLDFGPPQFTYSLESLGLHFDATASARQAYRVGRTGNLGEDLQTEIRSLLWGRSVEPEYHLDNNLWSERLKEITHSLIGRDARFAFDNKLYIQEEVPGSKASYREIEEKIKDGLLSLKNPLRLEFGAFEPSVTTEDLRPFFSELQKTLNDRPALRFAGKSLTVSESDFLEILKVDENGLSVNLEEVKALVSRLTQSLNRPAKALTFEVEGGFVKNFSPGEDGLEVSLEETVQTFAKEILSGKGSRVEAVVKRTKAPVGENELGIKEVLAEGLSNFSGSIPGRVRNIKRAAAQMNGVLVPPDGDFSFNQAIGEISSETGYDYAYIIKEGRTVLGTGGGVCQVSTTVFRAALNAGLPILKRSAHAYRVHYYEQGSPVGLDATVYPPTVDLQFKNDTGSYILVATQIEGDDLRVGFYGRSDGRQVEFTGPTILSSSSPPASLYQEDASLARGIIKQVDFAAGGALVVLGRKVTRGGEFLFEDKFTSRYRPWRAIYLVGTKPV